MKKENPFEIDFESYIREGDPDKKEKSIAWSIATGLQQVDGLTPSAYLYETAKRNIEGEISIEEAKKLIDSYYESKTSRTEDDDDTEEADKVSTRITELLSENLRFISSKAGASFSVSSVICLNDSLLSFSLCSYFNKSSRIR